jgi:hypothetical protein
MVSRSNHANHDQAKKRILPLVARNRSTSQFDTVKFDHRRDTTCWNEIATLVQNFSKLPITFLAYTTVPQFGGCRETRQMTTSTKLMKWFRSTPSGPGRKEFLKSFRHWKAVEPIQLEIQLPGQDLTDAPWYAFAMGWESMYRATDGELWYPIEFLGILEAARILSVVPGAGQAVAKTTELAMNEAIKAGIGGINIEDFIGQSFDHLKADFQNKIGGIQKNLSKGVKNELQKEIQGLEVGYRNPQSRGTASRFGVGGRFLGFSGN